METKQEEQLNPVDALMTAPDPVVETPAAEPAPEAPAEQPPAEVVPAPEQPAAEPPSPETPAPPSEPAPPETPPEEKVPLAVHLHKVNKVKETARTQLSEKQKRIAELEHENQVLRQTQPKEADPLKVWKANPENQDLAVPDEVVQQHDEFVRRDAQRQTIQPPQQPVNLQQAAAYADQLIDSDPRVKSVVAMAHSYGWLNNPVIEAIARDPNPKAKAVEIIRDYADAWGTDEDVAFINQLFPPQPAVPTPSQPPVRPPTAPVQTRRTPAPKPAATPPAPPQPPKETTDEDTEYQPRGSSPRTRSIVDAMFDRRV